MGMLPDQLSRREILGISGVGILGLAGCAGDTVGLSEQTASPTASEREYAHAVESPESVTVRATDGVPAVRSSARTPNKNLFDDTTKWDDEEWLVRTTEERDSLLFSASANGIEQAQSFLTGTELSETTLLVHQYTIDRCATKELDRLAWDTNRSCGEQTCSALQLEYQRIRRDEMCGTPETDATDSASDTLDSEATFVRIPAQIEQYRSFGTRS